MTRWGLPSDPVALTALAVSLLSLAALRFKPRWRPKPGLLLLGICLAAFALSAGYVAHYLRGGPRIIDATTYYLQARTYANGELGFTPPPPEAAHFGRFLLSMPDGRLSSLFPPGYPALLALGFRLGVPMWVGPALGAAIALATYWVAALWFEERRLALLAAAMSALCATLRYHTADTMAHGLCALLTLLAVGGVSSPRRAMSLVSGLALGWLYATRPVSGMALTPVLLAVVAQRHSGPRELRTRGAALCLSLIGIALFAWQQQRVTGAWGISSQYHYYALADDPGCFRYGLGAGIGCPGEHGDFVATYLPHGYGPLEALLTTLRRLAQHGKDAGNSELFGVLVLVALWLGRREPRVRLLGVLLAVHVVAYTGFYFDGNYPGGGARMFVDVMPFEHVLLAWLFVRLGWTAFALPSMALGFAVHGSFDHEQLREREGGAPMYDREYVARRVPERALVFVGSDHGYALGRDPTGKPPWVVRAKGDGLDFGAWRALGSPPAFRYLFDFTTPHAQPELVPFVPRETTRFELENQWPPRRLEGAARREADPSCGGAPGLWLAPGSRLEAVVWLEAAGPRELVFRAHGDLAALSEGGAVPLTRTADGAGCASFHGEFAPEHPGDQRIWVHTQSGVWVDFVELPPAP